VPPADAARFAHRWPRVRSVRHRVQ
jgi:hypothetical protein